MWGSVQGLCVRGCLHHPWPPLIRCRNVPPVMAIKNASRLCQMSPGEQNCPRLRSTAVTDHVTLERSVTIPEPEPSSRKLVLKSRRKLHTSLWFWPTEVLSAFAGLLPHAQHHAVDEGSTGKILFLVSQVAGETKPVFINQRTSLELQCVRGVLL